MFTIKRLNLTLDTLFWGAALCLLVVSGTMQWVQDDGFLTSSFYLLVIAILAFDAGVISHVAFHFRRDMPMLLFVMVYNVLLLGRVYFNCIYYRHRLIEALEAEGWHEVYTATGVILTCLIAFVAAYYLIGPLFKRREKQMERGERSVQKPVVPVIRQLSRVALYVSSIPFFYTLAIKVLAVLQGGYLASFTQTMEIPSAVSRLSTLFVPSFVIFLGTLPSWRQMRWPLVVYAVYMGASLFTGRRNMLVTEALMLLFYFFFRDVLRPRERRRLNWKWAIPVLVTGVFGAYMLQQMAYARNGYVNWGRSLGSVLMSFLDSQGASFRVVVQTVNHQSMIPPADAIWFLLYPFELFFHNNAVIQALFGLMPIVEVQTPGFAQETHNYAHWLTYAVDPQRYVSGGGFGTSFVAESYAAGGVLSVILVAAVLGMVFRWLPSLLTRNWVGIAAGLFVFRLLIYTPRNFAFSWVTETFSITNVAYVAAMYVAALLVVQIGTHVRRQDHPPQPRLKMHIRLKQNIGG